MNRKTDQVFRGFLNLSPDEQNDLIDAINDHNKQGYIKQKEIKERFNERVDLGPISSARCACCGR